jgi:hypothetical protein
MFNVVSPRIHNLGDFSHCLPILSGLYKLTGEKMHFMICNRLERFRGIKELLMAQEMFTEISFMHEIKEQQIKGLLIDDTGTDEGYGTRPIAGHKFYTYLRDTYKIDFQCDDDFELKVPKLDIDYHNDTLIVGDRWAPKDAPDVDTRRYSNLIENAKIFEEGEVVYLDYTKDLLYNCALVKYNPNPFITTFTGIGILADLMKKEMVVAWDEDMRIWQGLPVEHDFDLHYYKDRNAKLVYVKDLK